MVDGAAIGKVRHSPIVQAIAEAEIGTTAKIHVRLTKRWFERDPLKRARAVFHRMELHRAHHRNEGNNVLIYVNLRSRKFAVLGDDGVHRVAGQRYWNELARELKQGLLSTHPERAIALAVRHVGEMLKKNFPENSFGGQTETDLKPH